MEWWGLPEGTFAVGAVGGFIAAMIFFVLVCLALMWILYHRKIFLKV